MILFAWTRRAVRNGKQAKKIKAKIYVFTGNRTMQRPFAFKASALDHWATLTVDKLWLKLFHGT